ncbi:Zn-dependent hydrolase [Candidimonas humi]|nr:Zn-dependent hydrolase [Candidimonas humi]MBV6304547.1 Zn-dependent hydrolase [Candidimonas humi]
MITVDEQRLWNSLMEMAEIGRTANGGSCRLTLSDDDVAGRRLFMQWCGEAGCQVYTDEVGNIYARRAGADPDAPPVLCGSHLDTQPLGGRFDGVYGVLAGLEALRRYNELGISTRHPIEVVAWTNEEGSRFTPGVLGSAVYAGRAELAFARGRPCMTTGVTLGEELDRTGFSNTPLFRERPRAYYEAHIEQGPILEAAAVPLGVVTGVQGLYEYDVTLTGYESHAGTTPMQVRRDALACAAGIITALVELGRSYDDITRMTVGHINCRPNSPSTIPGHVVFSVDLRHPDLKSLDFLAGKVVEICNGHAQAQNIEIDIERVAAYQPIQFDPGCVDRVRQASLDLGLPSLDMCSGAGHDAVNLSYVAPSAMIFVPCRHGLSHNEQEYAEPRHLAQGASVLANVLLTEAGAF